MKGLINTSLRKRIQPTALYSLQVGKTCKTRHYISSKESKLKQTKYKNKPQGEFASGLERYCFDILRLSGLNFEFQKTFILQDSFKRSEEHQKISRLFTSVNSLTYAKGKKAGKAKNVIYQKNVLSLTMRLDFFLEGIDFDVIIDTKGAKTQDWLNKCKILEMKLSKNVKPTLILIPSSQKEIKLVIQDVLKHLKQVI